MTPATLYSLALVRAHRGQAQDARDLATEALVLCERTGNVPVASQLLSVLGFIALSLDDYQAAHAHLSRLADAIAVLGPRRTKRSEVPPDEIEAWPRSATRSRAIFTSSWRSGEGRSGGRGRWQPVRAAEPTLPPSTATSRRPRPPASRHSRIISSCRCRSNWDGPCSSGHDRAASQAQDGGPRSLGQALGIFEHLGAPLWAGKARGELSKIAARTPADGLTETERRIAGLVAQGQTNREVASAMFVTENTVQTHIRHIFQKLGVRSRTELAAQLVSAPASATPVARPPTRSGAG